MRKMRQIPVTFYTCNANHITNKMPTVAQTTYEDNLNVIHITEAGLQQKLPDALKGY